MINSYVKKPRLRMRYYPLNISNPLAMEHQNTPICAPCWIIT